MGNLLASLLNTANALRAFEQSLTVTQNNVTNANTPGYVKQTLALVALPFDVASREPGGVGVGGMLSSRDAFSERTVRDQQAALGYFKQKAADLLPVETAFDLSSTGGLAPALSDLFKTFSQLSVNPNDSVSRQAVINQATTLAQTFQNTANSLSSQGSGIDQNSRSTIDGINRLAAVIAEVNSQNRIGSTGNVNAGVDAQLNASLEELSQLVNFTALEQPDGSVTIYVGGQTPLVVGNQTFLIKGDFSTAQTAILNAQGVDISAQITSGKLSALLDDKNVVLPSYINDLNTLAQGVADQVNATLNSGVDLSGAAPSADLFTYDAVIGAAVTLRVNPLTPDQIAAALPGASGGNGNALILAGLRDTKNLNGYSFAQFYGNLGARVGRDSASAKDAQATKEQLLSQALTLREQTSGVSLDEEAEHLMALQRSYQAISKMLGVLNDLTDTLINIIK